MTFIRYWAANIAAHLLFALTSHPCSLKDGLVDEAIADYRKLVDDCREFLGP